MKKSFIDGQRRYCRKCGHIWFYNGKYTEVPVDRFIRCPKCAAWNKSVPTDEPIVLRINVYELLKHNRHPHSKYIRNRGFNNFIYSFLRDRRIGFGVHMGDKFRNGDWELVKVNSKPGASSEV